MLFRKTRANKRPRTGIMVNDDHGSATSRGALGDGNCIRGDVEGGCPAKQRRNIDRGARLAYVGGIRKRSISNGARGDAIRLIEDKVGRTGYGRDNR